ncbi:MAG: NUDIX hydrolase [Armatimonadetes bacterium]|nr:NUDIX hydrolase [Armatimonadota bacterium]
MTKETAIDLEVGLNFLQAVREKAGPMATANEVVLLVPRRGGKVLLHTKSFYPAGTYRLPTGRMLPGETPEVAFGREFREELGQDGAIERKLGIIRCRLISGNESVEIVSHVYLSQELAQEPYASDEDEQITGFVDVPFEELSTVARRLRALPNAWRDWGRFRAIAHDFVAGLDYKSL